MVHWRDNQYNDEICYKELVLYRAFSYDVMSVMLVSQNNKTAVMLVSQTSSVVTKSHAQLFVTRVKTLYTCLFFASVFRFVCMHRSLFVYLFICSLFYFKVMIITLLDFRIIVPPLLPPLVGVSKTAYVLPVALMTASIEKK